MEATSAPEGILKGAYLMLAFGLGTVPALFLVARLAGLGWLKSKEVIYRMSSVLMMGVGVYFVIKGIRY
jgi:sulfite exporter TauE/SafE